MPTTQERLDDLAHTTAQTAVNGLNNSLNASSRALERLSESAADWRHRASNAAQQGAQWVRESGDQVRSQIVRASDRTVGYVRDEPVRAALIAVAAGAVLYAVARLISGRREH